MLKPSEIKSLTMLCQGNDVAMLAVFGSVATGHAREGSDIDLVVRFSKPKTLLKLVALERQIAEIVARKVDLVTEAAVSPYMRDQVFKEMKVLYEAS